MANKQRSLTYAVKPSGWNRFSTLCSRSLFVGSLKLLLRPLSFLRSTQYAKYDAREKRLATKLQKMDKRAAFCASILLAPFFVLYCRKGVPIKIPASTSAILWIKEETHESSESWSDYEYLDICYLCLMYDYRPYEEALTRVEANKVLEAIRHLPLISKRTKFVWLISQAIRRRPMHLGILNAIPVIPVIGKKRKKHF